MENNIIFRMAARCEAAGRPNNEDNYQVDENLSDNKWGFTADKELSLSEKGALLVVCDGMGGMNAGEVASAIAVNTIKKWFDAERLTDEILSNDKLRLQYIQDAIQAADEAIKQDSKQNPEHEGMGSTIVLAWLLGKKVYVGWCGDSRAYRYNSKTGLVRLSHDHSYVQELVDAGKLTEELAFDHPDNNIITRSLGDPRGKAQPDTRVFDLANEDIILLCSDGLCGCLRDKQIETVISNNQTSMQQLRDALWQADEAAGWHDNVTIVLAQILSGAMEMPASEKKMMSDSKAKLIGKNRRLKIIITCLVLLIVIVIGVFGGLYLYKQGRFSCSDTEVEVIKTETENEEKEEEAIVPSDNDPAATPVSGNVELQQDSTHGKAEMGVRSRTDSTKKEDISVILEKYGETDDAPLHPVQIADSDSINENKKEDTDKAADNAETIITE